MSSAVLKLRLDENLKKQASELATSMGFTVSDAVRMFLVAFVNEQKIPFDVVRPNKETVRAIMDVEAGNTVRHDSFSSLMEEIHSEISKGCSTSR